MKMPITSPKALIPLGYNSFSYQAVYAMIYLEFFLPSSHITQLQGRSLLSIINPIITVTFEKSVSPLKVTVSVTLTSDDLWWYPEVTTRAEGQSVMASFKVIVGLSGHSYIRSKRGESHCYYCIRY